MECNCSKGKFWIGLGLGAVIGAVVYGFAKTDKAKALKTKMCCAAHTAAEKAGEWMAGAKENCACTAEDEESE